MNPMEKRNMHAWRQSVLSGIDRQALPIMTHPGIDIIGKRVLDAITDGETHFRAIQAMSGLYPTAAATMIMDLTVEAEAFGCSVSFPEQEVPTVTGILAGDAAAVARLQIPDLTQGRVREYLKAAQLAATHIRNKPVLGGCIGPFSLAGRLFGMTEIMTAVFTEPETIMQLVEKCSRFILTYIHALKATGTNGIIMAEPAAGLLDEESCSIFSSAFIQTIVAEVQD
jgi:uroporphyrinogen decarboxylase